MGIDATVTLDSVNERAGNLAISLTRATVKGQVEVDSGGRVRSLTSSIAAQDLRAGNLALRSVELKAVKLDGPQLNLEAAASGEGWQFSGAKGTVGIEADAGEGTGKKRSVTVVLDMQSSGQVPVTLGSAGATGFLGSIKGRARGLVDGWGVRVLDASLSMIDGSLRTDSLALSDICATAVMPSPGTVDLTSLSATVGDGGTVSAAPFTVDLRAPRIHTRLSMSNLSLAEWLPVITSHHATGEGRISGDTDVSIDLTSETPRLDQLSGSLRADPPHGFVQATDADALGALLDAQAPRLSTDTTTRPVRDKIIVALRDFAFHALTIDLAREEAHTVVRAYLSGFGRHGEDPQGLNITLDLHVQDALVEFVSRLVTESKVRAATQRALDKFFEAPASGDAPR